MSQFINNKRLILIKKEIANLNNSDFIKNSKNHKRTFSAKVFQVFSKIVADKNKKLNSNQKFNFYKNYSVKINYIFHKKNLFTFDFNSINLLFFGCCIYTRETFILKILFNFLYLINSNHKLKFTS